jgi:hypothetical protein
MADPEHVRILTKVVDRWNKWRRDNLIVRGFSRIELYESG